MPGRTLAKVHKWMGIWLAAYFGLQAVAGIVLTFETDVLRWYAGDDAATIGESTEEQGAALEAVIAVIEDRYPGRHANRINFPVSDSSPFLARLPASDGGSAWVEVDPIAGTARSLSTPFQLMETVSDFHINLLAGKAGHYLVGISGLALLASVISGLILGWPGLRRLRRALRVSFRTSLTGWYLLHRSTGLLGALIILATTLTGSMMVAAPFIMPSANPGGDPVTAVAGAALPAASLFERARSVFPDNRVRNVRLQDEHAVYRVVISGERNGRAGPSNQVWLNPYTGNVRATVDGDNLPAGEAFFAWMYPLHIEFGLGRLGQLLSVAGAIALLMLSVSGFLVWAKRRQAVAAKRNILQAHRGAG